MRLPRLLRLTWVAGMMAVTQLLAAVPCRADWEVVLKDDSTFRLTYDGAPIAQSGYASWAGAWRWVSTTLRFTGAAGDPRRHVGRISGQGLPADVDLQVDVRTPADNQLAYTVTASSTQSLRDVTGFCMTVNFAAASAALRYRPSLTYHYPEGREHTMEVPDRPAAAVIEPAVQELQGLEKMGFDWHLPDGQAISARFDRPVKATLERTMEMRIWYVGGARAAGRQSVTITFTFPEGTVLAPSLRQKLGPARLDGWHSGALQWDRSPVDLSFLNEKPAGVHGFLAVRGDEFVFEDGSPARFWGGNLAAYALFSDKEQMEQQAQRIARLGFNLMRVHHHDSMGWVSPTVIDKQQPHSQALDPEAMDKLDYLIYCLKQQGVYVFLDLHVGRQFKSGDNIPGFSDLDDRGSGAAGAKGFCYYNERVEQLMKDFNEKYLSHLNPYTGLAYKDDPAIVAVLITNENDLTTHFGNTMLPDKNNPFHNAIFEERVRGYCEQSGLPYEKTWRTWEHGPSKRYLNHEQARWFASMAQHLRRVGLRVPVVGTQFWAGMGMWDLPALATMDFMAVNSYGGGEPYALGVNPRYNSNFVIRTVAAQVVGKPLVITEWHTPWPNPWRAVSPLYVAAIGSLQGWDAPMLYNYAQDRFGPPSRPRTWTTYYEPAVMGAMPAAALAFRRGDFRLARQSALFTLSEDQTYNQGLSDSNMTALRTLAERHRVYILPPQGTKELALKTNIVVKDPSQNFLPEGQDYVRSDTGEIYRNWAAGIQTFNSPRTQGAQGLIGYEDNGKLIDLDAVAMDISTPFGVVVASSLDDLPLERSRSIFITAVGRAQASQGNLPFLTEPVVGTLRIKNANAGMQLMPLGPGGEALSNIAPRRVGEVYELELSREHRTHWYLLHQE